MADVKTFLKQFGADGLWSRIFIGSSSDLIERPDGTTAEAALAALETNKADGPYKIYTSPEQLDVTLSDASVADIFAAMENNSLAVLGLGNNASRTAWPDTAGTAVMFRVTNEFCVAFYKSVTINNNMWAGGCYNGSWRGWVKCSYAVDSAPTENSQNIVLSGAIYTAMNNLLTIAEQYSDAGDQAITKALNASIATVQGTLDSHIGDDDIHVTTSDKATWNGKQNQLTFDTNPTTGSNNPVTSSGIKAALDQKAASDHNHDGTYVKETSVGAANGVAPLGDDQRVPAQYLPSYVDDVIEGTYVSATQFNDASTGAAAANEAGKIYVDTTTNKIYRWSGTQYTEIPLGVALGETEATAYRGDRGKAAYDHSQTATGRSNTTASQSLANGGNFQAVTLVTDNGGHVTGVRTTTFTLPTIASGNRTVSQASQPTNQVEGDLWFETL